MSTSTTTPAYMARIPTNVLNAGGRRLLSWLAEANLPRPSLLHLDAERQLRKHLDAELRLRKPAPKGRR